MRSKNNRQGLAEGYICDNFRCVIKYTRNKEMEVTVFKDGIKFYTMKGKYCFLRTNDKKNPTPFEEQEIVMSNGEHFLIEAAYK